MSLIELRDITFGYKRDRAILSRFSLAFGTGRTVLLGPNGAGKSTMLGLLANALEPTSGNVVLEESLSPQASRAQRTQFRRMVAWLPQQIYPFPSLTVREQVAYMGWLKGVPRSESWSRSIGALENVELAERANDPARSLSGGQMRRMGLAGALVHEARVILLDEPTAGLDPSQRNRFRELLSAISGELCVVVSTHQTEDVHDSYQRAVLLADGDIRFDGTIDEFVEGTTLELDVRDRVALGYSRLVAGED